jgi:hypothetical protein
LHAFNLAYHNDSSFIYYSFICVSFLGSAATVIASFEGILEEKIAAIAAFGVTITANAVANNSTWPFVTIDQFQQRSASSLSLSGCMFLELAPIVTEENRLAWEEYSVANTGWLTEGRQYQAEKGLGTMVGGDPYINEQIVSIDESGTDIISEQAVSMTKPSIGAVFGTFFHSKLTSLRSIRSSAAGTVFSDLAVISCIAFTSRRCQLQSRDATSIWDVCFSFSVNGTNSFWRNSCCFTRRDHKP